MRERTLVCLLVAVAAFGLPWQRCASDCHDRLMPAVAAHECHEEPCHESEDDGDHERIEFLAVPFGAPPALVAVHVSVAGTRAAVALPLRGSVEFPPRALPPDGEPPTATTVLLI